MNNLKKYTFIGILFVSIFGTILHFAYNWSGKNFFVGLFTPVNESTFEHMKLIFFPMFIYSVFLWYKLRYNYPCIFSISILSTIIGTILIPILFYTYTGILGFNNLVLDISTFLLSVIIAFIYMYKNTLSCTRIRNNKYMFILAIIIAILFMIFSYNAPNLGIFSEP
jgi:hypothetical protein